MIKIKNILEEFKADQTQIKRGLVNWNIQQKKISVLFKSRLHAPNGAQQRT